MPEETKIAWTDSTFNMIWGCTKVSPGCTNCYALTLAHRYHADLSLWGPTADRLTFSDATWRKPLAWNRRAERLGQRHKVFCSSLADNFEDHPTVIAELPKLWALIRQTPYLDWQLLTKRSDRIALSLPHDWGHGYPNVWLGVSIENMDYAYRADDLRRIPAVVRFVSYEPALGPLNMLRLHKLDWVIYGGESGPGFRPENPQWTRAMYRHCQEHGVAYFHKQESNILTERGTMIDGVSIQEYPIPRALLTLHLTDQGPPDGNMQRADRH